MADFAAGDTWKVDLGARTVSVRPEDGGIRVKWFSESQGSPMINLGRHPSLAAAASAIWGSARGTIGDDFGRIYSALDVSARRFRYGGPGFRPRSPIARQAIDQLARAATRTALGYADVACWCQEHGVVIEVPSLPDYMQSALDDRRSDRGLGIGLESAVEQRSSVLAAQIVGG